MKKKNNKIDNKMKIGIGVVVGFALLIGLTSTSFASLNFWEGIQNKLTDRFWSSVTATPDFSVPDIESFGAMPGPNIMSEYLCVGDICTYHLKGAFISASSTMFSIKNPFSSTSTVTFAQLEVSGQSTTSLRLFVATSTTVGVLDAGINWGSLINNATLATSTMGIVTNGITATNTDNGAISAGTSQYSIILSPSQYLVGYATTSETDGTSSATSSSNIVGGFMGNNSDWAGKYIIDITR